MNYSFKRLNQKKSLVIRLIAPTPFTLTGKPTTVRELHILPQCRIGCYDRN